MFHKNIFSCLKWSNFFFYMKINFTSNFFFYAGNIFFHDKLNYLSSGKNVPVDSLPSLNRICT